MRRMPLFYRPRTLQGKPLPPIHERLVAFRHIPRFLRMVWQAHPLYCGITLAVRLTSALSPVAMLWVGKLLIDALVVSITSADFAWDLLLGLILLELSIALVSEVLSRISALLETLLGDKFSNDLSILLMRTAAALDLQQLEDADILDKMQRARRQTSTRTVLLSQLLATLQQTATLASMLAVLMAFNPVLLVVLALAILPSFLGETAYTGITYAFQYQWTPQRRRLDYYQWLMSSLPPAKEIKLLGLSQHFVTRYSRLANDFINENRRVAIHRAATGATLTALSTLAYYGAVAVVAYETAVGAITMGTFTLLVGSFRSGRSQIRSILANITSGYEHGLHLKDFFGFLEEKPRITNLRNGRPVRDRISKGLVLEHVAFRYPGAQDWALRDISFEIRPNERIALVGENGAGKSTLVKLLTRLYDPTEGRILLDGTDLRNYDVESLRKAIGVMFQDFFRYDLTARDNIAMGEVDLLEHEEHIVEAAKRSYASEIIAKLENGYDQMLGRGFENGVDLSVGEWQRIALARAYMRDAQILILDEPTAFVDARSEYRICRSVKELVANRTTILISHRFSTVRIADRILLLRDGRIVEEGAHEALVERDGYYAYLYSLQASQYK